MQFNYFLDNNANTPPVPYAIAIISLDKITAKV